MLKKWNQSMGNEKSTAYLMVFPTAVIITLLGIVPILYVVWLSLCKVNPVTMETEFAGLQNYTETLSNPGFWQSMGITFYFTIVSIALQLFLGVCVALLLNQDFRGRWLVRTLCILPWAVPTLVNANLWKWMLNTSYGIINKLLIALHIVDEGIFWLGDPKLTLNCVILVDTWRMLPMVTLMLLADRIKVYPGSGDHGRGRRGQKGVKCIFAQHQTDASRGAGIKDDPGIPRLRYYFYHDERRTGQRNYGNQFLHLL